MNKLIALTFIYCFSFIPTKAQHNFSQTSSTYSDLTSPVSINNGVSWYDTLFTVPIGFNFNFLGQNYDKIFIKTHNAVFYFDTLSKTKRLVPFFADLIDINYGMPGSLSPLSYKLDKGIIDTILKIEFKEAAFGSDITSRISFQTWLYKNSNKIEFKIGPNAVNDPLNAYGGTSGPMIGLVYNYDVPADSIKSAFLLSGIPSSAQAMHINSNNFSFVNGTPVSGTVYQFMVDLSGINGENNSSLINVFPNPCPGKFNLEFTPNLYSAKIEILNMEGKAVLNDVFNVSSLIKTIDLSTLPNGIYSLKIISNKISISQKIVLLKNI